MTGIDYLNIALAVVVWLVCGLGLYFVYEGGITKANPIQAFFLVFVWPATLFVLGLVSVIVVMTHFVFWLDDGLRGVDYKLAFSNSLKKVFKDRFFWGSLIGSIVGGIYVDSDLDFWVLIFMFLVVFLVVSFLTDDKAAE